MHRSRIRLPKPPQLSTLAKYTSVPLIIGLMALIQHLLLPEPQTAPFLFFFFGVVICAWLAGRWPGLIAVLISGLLANFYFVSPYYGWGLSAPALTMTAMFMFTAGITALLCGSLRDAMLAAEHAAEQLREGQRLLREADEHKNHFMSVLSHELRNPLAPISSALFILDHTSTSTEQAARARTIIERQVRHLTRIVDDLLDVTRISRGKIELQRARVDLVEIVGRTLADYRSLFSESKTTLECTLADQPIWIDGDPTRLAQILSNLLANSAKFARGETTWVSVEQHGGDAIIRVRDNGLGIDPELLEHLFEPFVQADRTLARTSGGLGLGLALVKGLTELHGGRVTAVSAGEGMGSEFTVVLPLATATSVVVAREPEPARVTRSRRILVIEDNIDAAASLKEALEVSGHDVAVEHDAVAGIAKARAWRPEVVVCDIGLPSMSGYEVAKALRTDRELGRAFLIALTGYALPEDREKAGRAGFDRHLAKPPLLNELERLIAQADGLALA